MNPIPFKETNCTYAENQPQYLPLPVYKQEDGEIWSCWKLTPKERIKILFTGRLWLGCMTFNKPLQPLRPLIDNPFNRHKIYKVE